MYFDPPILIQGQMSRGKGHTDDVIGAGSDRLPRPAARRTSRSRLLYQFKAPHRGWEPAPRFANAFEDVEIPPPPDLYESLASRPLALRLSDMRLADMPDYRNRGVRADMPEEERARLNWQHFIKDYYRVLLGVDENVGRFLDYLDAQGLSENTLIVYTSDNGFFLGENGLFDKRLMYEPSIRVPMLVRHPASIPAGQVNRQHMVLNIDVAPTFLDAGGAAAAPAMQGRSWLPSCAAASGLPTGARTSSTNISSSRRRIACASIAAFGPTGGSSSTGTIRRRGSSTTSPPIRAKTATLPDCRNMPRRRRSCGHAWPSFAANLATSIRRATSRGIRRTSGNARPVPQQDGLIPERG